LLSFSITGAIIRPATPKKKKQSCSTLVTHNSLTQTLNVWQERTLTRPAPDRRVVEHSRQLLICKTKRPDQNALHPRYVRRTSEKVKSTARGGRIAVAPCTLVWMASKESAEPTTTMLESPARARERSASAQGPRGNWGGEGGVPADEEVEKRRGKVGNEGGGVGEKHGRRAAGLGFAARMGRRRWGAAAASGRRRGRRQSRRAIPDVGTINSALYGFGLGKPIADKIMWAGAGPKRDSHQTRLQP
jgi:hypothetical protein